MKKFLNAIRVILVIMCYTLYKAANVSVINQVAVNISLEHKLRVFCYAYLMLPLYQVSDIRLLVN